MIMVLIGFNASIIITAKMLDLILIFRLIVTIIIVIVVIMAFFTFHPRPQQRHTHPQRNGCRHIPTYISYFRFFL